MKKIGMRIVAAFLTVAASCAGHTQELPDPAEGFLCCTMRTDGNWISDMNLSTPGEALLPAGTPIKAVGYGRYRVHVEIRGTKQDIGNDFSRKLDMPTFARRYVVPTDPLVQLRDASAAVREAVPRGKLVLGMTREQVVMALGYPVVSENPATEAKRWHYWVTDDHDYWISFGDDGRLAEVEAEPRVKAFVLGDGEMNVQTEWTDEPEAMCALNVYRFETRDFKVAERPYLYLDDVKIGTLAVGQSYCLNPAAGRHTLAIREPLLGLPTFESKRLEILLEGKPIFVRYAKRVSGIQRIGNTAALEQDNSFGMASEAEWRQRR